MEFVNSNGEPLSPKKKVHCSKERLGETVLSVRDNLKTAKDISARNLLSKSLEHPESSHSGSSSYEEVMVIEEEGTDYVSDSEYVVEEEYTEESVSTDDSDLEPLPPPIRIPKELQVKDSDDEEIGSSSSDDDDGSGSSSENENNADNSKSSHDPNLRPTTYRGLSHYDNNTPTSPQAAPKPTPMKSFNETTDEDSSESEDAEKLTSIRPLSTRGSSFLEEPEKAKPEKHTPRMESFEEEPTPPSSPMQDDRIAWKKPAWTKSTKLRSTGKSPSKNLAKPITSLPHMNKLDLDDNEEEDYKPAAVVRPRQTASPTRQETPRSPPRTAKPYASLVQSPPSHKKAPPTTPTNEEDAKTIEWEKPEWAKKSVLKATKKGQQLQKGQEIARPIGGIRPVND